jgi:hypothetical protein
MKYTAGYPGASRGFDGGAKVGNLLSVGNKRFATRNFELLLHLFAESSRDVARDL